MESERKQMIVQVEKSGIRFYDQHGEQQEASSDVSLEPMAILSGGDATVINVDNELIQIKDIVNMEVSSIAFSPKKSYLAVCCKPEAGKKNLFILDKEMKIVAEHAWIGTSTDGCNNITWANDEKYMARKESAGSKELFVYEVAVSLQEDIGSLTVEKRINNFEMSPHGGDEEKPHFLLVGTCGGTSSLTRFYQLPNLEKEKFKNLSKGGQEINFVFAPNGHAVIIWASFDVDNTGENYYGQHDLRYVQLGGGNKRSKVAVFDTQVSDVAWSPDSADFIVISGKQPAVCTLYNNNCIPIFEFGRIHANTIRYSPFSNLVLLGGFGNLVGGIQVWNKDNFKLIGKNKAHCTVLCEWSPDGSQILTAVTHPRVRVDNEIKLFSFCAKQIQHRKIDAPNELYFAGWQPHDISNFAKEEIKDNFKMYDAEKDPSVIKEKSKTGQKKGTLNIPKSTAFSAMMRTEMSSVAVSGPRKLKKDDYKEYLIETVEEKNALKAKPKPKAKKTVKNSWRSSGGFNIPSKEAQEAEKKQIEEEKKLIPAPTEYRAPAPAGGKPSGTPSHPGHPGHPHNKGGNKNGGNQPSKNKKKKNRNRNKKKGPGGGGAPAPHPHAAPTPGAPASHGQAHGHGQYNQQQDNGYNKYYNEGYGDYQNYDY